MCCIVFRCPLCQLFYVHELECSICQPVWGANHQVSWGRGLGEQDGGGLHVEGTGLRVARVTGCCWCGFLPLVTGYSDQICDIKVPASTYDWTLLCHRRGHYSTMQLREAMNDPCNRLRFATRLFPHHDTNCM